MIETNLPAEPAFGAPPADAPMEKTQPLQPDAGTIIDLAGVAHRPIDKARMNERELEPLRYAGGVASQSEPDDNGVQLPADVLPVKPVQAAPTHRRPADPTRPAMSMDDDPVNASPARGLPGTAFSPHRTKPALQVEGGFGSAEMEYFPLDGIELKETVALLLAEIAEQIAQDMRFTIAATYPRYKASVQVVIEAETEERVKITRVLSREAVPLEVAQQHCDSIVFVVSRQRREFDDHDEVETPVDALRHELGMTGPSKVITQTPLGAMVSDIRLGL